MENNKNKKSVKFQGDVLNFCDFIQVFVFTRNHHLKLLRRLQRVQDIALHKNIVLTVINTPALINALVSLPQKSKFSFYLFL